MLGCQDAGTQGIDRVASNDWNRGLGHDRAAIEIGSDKVHGAARNLHAVGQRPFVGMQALVGGEERGVDIEHPVAPEGHELSRHHAHEPAAGNEIAPVGEQDILERGLERGSCCISFVIDDGGGEAIFAAPKLCPALRVGWK